MPEKKKPSEKRLKLRIPFVYGIEFDDADESALIGGSLFSGKKRPIKINDISNEGMQIVSPSFLSKGSKVKLSIKFPKTRAPTSRKKSEDSFACVVHAKVQWVRRHVKGKGYVAGLMFSKFEDHADEVINRYVEENILLKDELL